MQTDSSARVAVQEVPGRAALSSPGPQLPKGPKCGPECGSRDAPKRGADRSDLHPRSAPVPGWHVASKAFTFCCKLCSRGLAGRAVDNDGGMRGRPMARRSEPAAVVCTAQPKKNSLRRYPHPPTHVSVSPASCHDLPKEIHYRTILWFLIAGYRRIPPRGQSGVPHSAEPFEDPS